MVTAELVFPGGDELLGVRKAAREALLIEMPAVGAVFAAILLIGGFTRGWDAASYRLSSLARSADSPKIAVS